MISFSRKKSMKLFVYIDENFPQLSIVEMPIITLRLSSQNKFRRELSSSIKVFFRIVVSSRKKVFDICDWLRLAFEDLKAKIVYSKIVTAMFWLLIFSKKQERHISPYNCQKNDKIKWCRPLKSKFRIYPRFIF